MNWIKKIIFGDAKSDAKPAPASTTSPVRLPIIGEKEFTQPLPVLSPGEPIYEVEIPALGELEYQGTDYSAGRTSGHEHLERMLEIFSDSIRIAISSKKPDTAKSRYLLSIATYHEILACAPPCPDLDYVTRLMNRVVALYPASACVNEAVGYLDKAAKLKSAKGKRKWLSQAREALSSVPEGSIVARTGFEEAQSRLDDSVSQIESM